MLLQIFRLQELDDRLSDESEFILVRAPECSDSLPEPVAVVFNGAGAAGPVVYFFVALEVCEGRGDVGDVDFADV